MTRPGPPAASAGQAATPVPASRASLGWLRRRYAETPVAAAVAMFAVLAAVRIGGAFSLALMVASIALTPAVLLALPRPEWRRLGLTRVAAPGRLAAGLAATVGAYAVVVLACAVAFGSGKGNWTVGIRPVFTAFAPGRPAVALVVAVCCMGVLVPVAEEVCYRGVLHDAVAGRAGPAAAVVTTAAGWAAVHLGDYGLHPLDGAVIAGMLPSVFLMGLALGWCRLATSSVLGSILAQASANLLLTAWVFTR